MAEYSFELFGVIIEGGNGQRTIVDNTDIQSLYFIEDIYSWCKTGKLIMSDSMGIWEFLPLVGDEYIIITYATMTKPDSNEWEEKTYRFKIHSMGEISGMPGQTTGTRERTTRYAMEIFFIEEPYFKLRKPAYSKTWIDYKYYDIIKEIFRDHVGIAGFILDEPSDQFVEFFSMSQKSPAVAISWLGERIKGDWSGESGFMFYSNTKVTGDSYNIVTMETLLKDAPLLTEVGDPPGIYFIGGSANEHAINTISHWTLSPPDKTAMAALTKDVYLGYDIYRKYMIKMKYDYEKSQAHYTTLGKKTLFNGAELLSHMPYSREVLTGESGDKFMKAECLMDNMYLGNWVKQYCLEQLVSIVVRGHVRRYAGAQVEINWLSGNEHEKYNKQYMGRYLIKSITHVFTNKQNTGTYTQKMTLIKNGYWDTDAVVSVAAKPKVDRTDVKPTIFEAEKYQVDDEIW